MKRILITISLIFLITNLSAQEKTSRKDLQGYWVTGPDEEVDYPVYTIYIGNKEYVFYDDQNYKCKDKLITESLYGFNDSCEIYTWEDLKDSGYYYFSEASRYYGKEDHVKGSPCGIIMGGVHLDQMTKKDTIMILTYLGGQAYTIYKKIPRLPEHVEKCLEERGIEYKMKKKNNH